MGISKQSIEDLKNGEWEISNLEFEKINRLNFRNSFEEKFNDYDEVNSYYFEIFNYLNSSNNINNTNIFERGGRSYMQNPFGRLRYKIYKNF